MLVFGLRLIGAVMLFSGLSMILFDGDTGDGAAMCLVGLILTTTHERVSKRV
jgi:hypothetical protein